MGYDYDDCVFCYAYSCDKFGVCSICIEQHNQNNTMKSLGGITQNLVHGGDTCKACGEDRLFVFEVGCCSEHVDYYKNTTILKSPDSDESEDT